MNESRGRRQRSASTIDVSRGASTHDVSENSRDQGEMRYDRDESFNRVQRQHARWANDEQRADVQAQRQREHNEAVNRYRQLYAGPRNPLGGIRRPSRIHLYDPHGVVMEARRRRQEREARQRREESRQARRVREIARDIRRRMAIRNVERNEEYVPPQRTDAVDITANANDEQIRNVDVVAPPRPPPTRGEITRQMQRALDNSQVADEPRRQLQTYLNHEQNIDEPINDAARDRGEAVRQQIIEIGNDNRNLEGVELGLDERGNAELRRQPAVVQQEIQEMQREGYVEMQTGGADPVVRIVGDAPYGRDIETNQRHMMREEDRNQTGMMIPHGRDIPQYMGTARPAPMNDTARVPAIATRPLDRRFKRTMIRDLVRQRNARINERLAERRAENERIGMQGIVPVPASLTVPASLQSEEGAQTVELDEYLQNHQSLMNTSSTSDDRDAEQRGQQQQRGRQATIPEMFERYRRGMAGNAEQVDGTATMEEDQGPLVNVDETSQTAIDNSVYNSLTIDAGNTETVLEESNHSAAPESLFNSSNSVSAAPESLFNSSNSVSAAPESLFNSGKSSMKKSKSKSSTSGMTSSSSVDKDELNQLQRMLQGDAQDTTEGGQNNEIINVDTQTTVLEPTIIDVQSSGPKEQSLIDVQSSDLPVPTNGVIPYDQMTTEQAKRSLPPAMGKQIEIVAAPRSMMKKSTSSDSSVEFLGFGKKSSSSSTKEKKPVEPFPLKRDERGRKVLSTRKGVDAGNGFSVAETRENADLSSDTRKVVDLEDKFMNGLVNVDVPVNSNVESNEPILRIRPRNRTVSRNVGYVNKSGEIVDGKPFDNSSSTTEITLDISDDHMQKVREAALNVDDSYQSTETSFGDGYKDKRKTRDTGIPYVPTQLKQNTNLDGADPVSTTTEDITIDAPWKYGGMTRRRIEDPDGVNRLHNVYTETRGDERRRYYKYKGARRSYHSSSSLSGSN